MCSYHKPIDADTGNTVLCISKSMPNNSTVSWHVNQDTWSLQNELYMFRFDDKPIPAICLFPVDYFKQKWTCYHNLVLRYMWSFSILLLSLSCWSRMSSGWSGRSSGWSRKLADAGRSWGRGRSRKSYFVFDEGAAGAEVGAAEARAAVAEAEGVGPVAAEAEGVGQITRCTSGDD